MSKTYKVKLGRATSEGRDERRIVCPRLVPEMSTLLGEALTEKGWVVDADGAKARKRFDKVEATITLDDPRLELKTKESVEIVGRSYELNDNDELGTQAAREDGDLNRRRFEKRAEEKVALTLAQAEPDVRAEVLGAVQVALLEALKRRAAGLGEIDSIERGTDGDGNPTTTIRVRV